MIAIHAERTCRMPWHPDKRGQYCLLMSTLAMDACRAAGGALRPPRPLS